MKYLSWIAYQFYFAILSKSYSLFNLESISPFVSVWRSLFIASAVALGLRATGLFSLFKTTFVGFTIPADGRYDVGTGARY